MAAHYLAEIRARQPSGPYRLGGYCIGGCLAFEMAQQLRAAGEEVEILVMIDAVPPTYRPGGRPSLLSRLAGRARRAVSKSPAELASALKRRVLRATGRSTDQGTGLDRLPSLYNNIPVAFRRVSAIHYEALQAWKPKPYPGDAWLLRSENEGFAEDFGWRPLIGGELRIATIDGPHSDVLKEPFLPANALRLAGVLEDHLTPRPPHRGDARGRT